MPSKDLTALEDRAYSGRGIVVGRTSNGNPFIGYTLTGRRPSSQARELLYDPRGVVRTNVIKNDERLIRGFQLEDLDQLEEFKKQLDVGDPALLVYPAIVHSRGFLIGSNGAHSNLIYDALFNSLDKSPRGILRKALSTACSQYDHINGWVNITKLEPDAPNHTPRISAVVHGDQGGLHIVRNGEKKLENPYWQFNLAPGTGKMITTYEGGNESPALKHFQGDPFDISITANSARGITDNLYLAISRDEDNFAVAAAVMLLDGNQVKHHVKNRF